MFWQKFFSLQFFDEIDTCHFDNLVWTLPIPEYDDTDPLHRDLAAAAAHAETIAAAVPLTDAQHFTAKRRAIREALAADGVAAEMEALVDALLPPDATLEQPLQLCPPPPTCTAWDVNTMPGGMPKRTTPTTTPPAAPSAAGPSRRRPAPRCIT